MPTYLSDVDFFRTRANIPSSVTDAQIIAELLDPVEQEIETYLGFSPATQSRVWFLNGSLANPSKLTLLPYTTSVASVYENQAGYYQAANFTSSELLTEGTDYMLEHAGGLSPGILTKINSSWPLMWSRAPNRLSNNLGNALGCVRVTFTAGLSALQMAQVREAAYLEATALYRSWKNPIGSVTSDSLDGASVSINPYAFNRSGLPAFLAPATEMILRRLRKIPVA